MNGGATTSERQPCQVMRKAVGGTEVSSARRREAPMTEVVLIGIVVLIFFAAGFAAGIVIVGVVGRWGDSDERRDAGCGPGRRPQ